MSSFSPFARAVRNGRGAGLCLAALIAGGAFAWTSDRDAARPATEPPLQTAAERYVLPISAPQDQGDTGLCWVYATLSMLETNYMSRHPGAQVEFSRAALQRDSIVDRFRRVLRGEPGAPGEGGLAVEAIALIHENGLLDRGDFPDVVNAEGLFAALNRMFALQAPPEEKAQALDHTLTSALGAKPGATHLEGRTLSPEGLARAALGGRTWTEYDLARDSVEGWGPSRDPEARPETRVRYVSLATLVDLIHRSLERREGVVAGTADHAFLIYGADYDGRGRPLAYLVKDSLAPYLYRADADEMHQRLNDVTVALEGSGASEGGGQATQTGARRL